MGIFDFLFKDKKEEEKEEKQIKELEEKGVNLGTTVENPCTYCNRSIEQFQERKKFGGNKFHKKCFKKIKKQAKKQAFG